MSYYTDYDISENKPEIITSIKEVSEYEWWDNTKINAKWYDHETDCKAVSVIFPDELITLSGEGEEGGHIWVKYFMNGKCQVTEAKITFEPFDESELK